MSIKSSSIFIGQTLYFKSLKFIFRIIYIACVSRKIFKRVCRQRWFLPTVTLFVMPIIWLLQSIWLLLLFLLTVRLFHSSTRILSFYGRCDLIVTPVASLPTLLSHLYPPLYSMYIQYMWCKTNVDLRFNIHMWYMTKYFMYICTSKLNVHDIQLMYTHTKATNRPFTRNWIAR